MKRYAKRYMKESNMKAAVFVEPHVMEVHEVPMTVMQKPDDAIIRVVKACVCGSDLWWFRGISPRQHGSLTGHEAIGIIEQVGPDVHELKPGDFAIVPFTHACGRCAACRAGFEANCFNAEPGGNAGYQAEYMRAVKADTALVKVPGGPASVAIYDREVLLGKVLDGEINPGRVFTADFDLDHVQDAYEAMDERRAVKSMISISSVR